METRIDKTATERLANERTFLAWVRTSVSIMSLGFVVAKFGLWLRELAGRFDPRMQPQGLSSSASIGVGMIAFGGALALLAAWRFHVVNRQISQGVVRADRWLVLLVTIALGGLAVLMAGYISMSGR